MCVGVYQRALLVAGVTHDQAYLRRLLPCKKKKKLCTLHFLHETGPSASTAATKASPEEFVGGVEGVRVRGVGSPRTGGGESTVRVNARPP